MIFKEPDDDVSNVSEKEAGSLVQKNAWLGSLYKSRQVLIRPCDSSFVDPLSTGGKIMKTEEKVVVSPIVL